MVRIEEYVVGGQSPFRLWLESLDPQSMAIVSAAILLGGGTKRRQQDDIQAALRRWRDYKKRKRDET
jgi:hypothetical protein